MALPLEVAQVRSAWAVVAGLDQLRDVQVVVDASSDLCPGGWVGLLALDETVTAVVPDAAMVPMAHVALAGLAPAQVTNPEVVVARPPTPEATKSPDGARQPMLAGGNPIPGPSRLPLRAGLTARP